MKNYTNPYSNERVYMVNERDLKALERKAVQKHKARQRRIMKQIGLFILDWMLRIIVMSVIVFGGMAFFFSLIPPM